MEIKLIGERYNPLLKRKEIYIEIKNDGATISRKECREKLIALFNADKYCLIVDNIKQEYGMKKCKVYVKIYDSKEFVKKYEALHKLRKNFSKEELKNVFGIDVEKEGEE